MRVALCQIPVSGDPAVNLARVKKATAQAAADGADLAIFPEATQVRFGSDLRHAAEPLDGPFGTALASAARDHATAIVAGGFAPAPAGGRDHPPGGVSPPRSRAPAPRQTPLLDALRP